MTILLLCPTKKEQAPATPGFARVARAANTNCCVLLAPKRCSPMLVWPMAAIRYDIAYLDDQDDSANHCTDRQCIPSKVLTFFDSELCA